MTFCSVSPEARRTLTTDDAAGTDAGERMEMTKVREGMTKGS